ncbi:uracil-DNA glycosylase [Cetobacterium somerae]|uniref:uracil-DNA glycosylase n=1 Tax=Cetobacterium somerae TaxID=188913 RepID=UPI003D76733D
MLRIGNDWDKILKEEFEKDYFLNMKEFLKKEYLERTIYPPNNEIFTAFRLTSYKDIKIVILGQDPYHGPGQAHGLAFSVKKGIALPPSLRNIYKEIINEEEGKVFNHGCLESWSEQGIFLLNATLTVRAGEPNSHSKIGWSTFTDEVIKKINEKKEQVIFVLWGNNAKAKKKFITNPNHIVIEGVHPSPLSASRGFFGCNHFKMINEILMKKNEEPIHWDIV